MTEYTRPATGDDVKHLARLNEAGVEYALRINDEFTIDMMPAVAGHGWRDLQPHIESIDLDGVPLQVLSLEGLLKTKQGARPKDQLDATLLRQMIEELKN